MTNEHVPTVRVVPRRQRRPPGQCCFCPRKLKPGGKGNTAASVLLEKNVSAYRRHPGSVVAYSAEVAHRSVPTRQSFLKGKNSLENFQRFFGRLKPKPKQKPERRLKRNKNHNSEDTDEMKTITKPRLTNCSRITGASCMTVFSSAYSSECAFRYEIVNTYCFCLILIFT